MHFGTLVAVSLASEFALKFWLKYFLCGGQDTFRQELFYIRIGSIAKGSNYCCDLFTLLDSEALPKWSLS